MQEDASARPTRSGLLPLLAAIALLGWGCSREAYREHADAEVSALLSEKTDGTPWELPADFSIYADPGSRLHDPSDPDYPDLPDPGPHLYDYEIPELFNKPLKLAEDEPESSPTTARPDPGADPEGVQLAVQPIPDSYWQAIPERCLERMLEFRSVREEHRRQYAGEDLEAPDTALASAERLNLDDIVELALMNSRDYQSQKEALYRRALALTLERFDYDTKLSSTGNGADADYSVTRGGGSKDESAGIFPSAQAEKLLATGGTLLARFANNIVFTFDGPEDVSKDISSELLFSVSQSVFQRDVRLNPLIQSERDLVYAARDFARFRREFFFQIASQYYGLLRNYRNIEIESQNYFSLVRTFEQAQAEVRAGVENAPNPVAVDQFEQGMLSGRSSLIATCNRLELALDSLKLTLGLPTELPLNIDLGELESLTLRDEIEVAAERVRRWLRRVVDRREQSLPDTAGLLDGGTFLMERLLDWVELRSRIERQVPDRKELLELLGRFRVGQARVDVERNVSELRTTQDPRSPSPIILVYQRMSDLVDSLVRLARRQADLAQRVTGEEDQVEDIRTRIQALDDRLEALHDRVGEILENPEQEMLERLLGDTSDLRNDADGLVALLDGLIDGTENPPPSDTDPETVVDRVDRAIEIARNLLEGARPGLPPVGIEADDAMGTALVQRLDLMNERGLLADDLRNVKLTADDLRSVLNLEASHSIRTRTNDAFNFSLDEGQTQLALRFDLPLNRRAQRNSYRRALIDYQAGRRSLMALEDTIKAEVRDTLRTLEETRIQYPISVTQAALAAEQVLSVNLQLTLGIQGVRGTDLLDALQSSREALISVANARIGYIIDRARFVLDLELMELDDSGVWREISDPTYRPEPNLAYPESAGPTYGRIPGFLPVSAEIRRIESYPAPGVAQTETGEIVEPVQPNEATTTEEETEEESGPPGETDTEG